MEKIDIHNNPDVKFGGFWRRALAVCIDAFIYTILLQVLDKFVFSGVLSKPELTAQLINGFFYVVIYSYFYSSKFQATPGKMLVGIKVVRAVDMGRLSLLHAVGRVSSIYLITIPLLFVNFESLGNDSSESSNISLLLFLLVMVLTSIWYLLAAFTKQKTAGHDLIAKTRVIRTR